MPKKNLRLISLRVLEDVFEHGAYGGIALSNNLEKHAGLTKSERALITEVTNGVLRNLTLIDYIIAKFAKTPPNKIKPVIFNILRQSVYEIMFMNTVDYAICSEAVETAKARGLGGLSGFVNGVLRNIARNKDVIILPDEKKEPVLYLSICYSHPEWLVRRWLRVYDYTFVKQMLSKNNVPPDVSVCVNTIKISGDMLVSELLKEGVQAEKSQFAQNALILRNPGSIKQLECYKQGYFHVQDMASQIAVELLAPKKGEIVVDLCAAPGGKSFYCAYLMKNMGKIYSSDIYAHKAKLIKDGADRLGIRIIVPEVHNAEEPQESLFQKADCVIVDAPCSGLGVIRKKPDIKLNRAEKDIIELQKIQRNILRAGASCVKNGGRLLYSTCTLTKEENEDNAEWFLDNFDFEIAEGGQLTLFPHTHNTDGFFMCLFVKKGIN